MKKIIYIFLPIFLLCSQSCKDKDDNSGPDIPVEPPLATNLTLLWETPLTVTNSLVGSSIPTIIDDKIAFAKRSVNPDITSEFIYMDKNTGEEITRWVNDDGVSTYGLSYSNGEDHFFGSGNTTYHINPETGETIQKFTDLTAGDFKVFGIEDYVFHAVATPNLHELMAYNIETLESKVLLSKADTAGYNANIKWCTPVISEEGDKWLYIMNAYFIGTNPSSSKLEMYCYNVTTDEMIWDHKFETIFPAANASEPGQLSNKNLIFNAGPYLFALDKLTGEKQWEIKFDWNMGGNANLVDDEKLYVLDGTGGMYRFLVIDAETGNIIGEQAGVKGLTSNMVRYKESIYYASSSDGQLYSLDRHTGKLNYKTQAPFKAEDADRFFLNGLAIDEETGRLYAFDWVSALCFQIED